MTYYENNVLGTMRLVSAMKRASVKTLVFSSSATVYGIPSYLPLDEKYPLGPTNPYGRTRFFIEEMLKDLQRSDEDWRELRERISAERFDLAVDLRKHTETRPVLQHTGARWLAGFDFRGRFPWLDVALEWTGDQLYARKRHHAGDDLVNLVDAIAAAGEPDRPVIAAPPDGTPAPGAPVIWVHRPPATTSSSGRSNISPW